MRSKRLSYAAVSVVTAALAATCLPAGTAEAASTTVPLPIAQYSHILVDPAHQHLFITSGTGYNTILVTDFSGRTVATIDNESGATGLTLSPDGGTVYAALADGDAVSAISTTTLTETARYDTGTDTDPTYVACGGGRIWFGYEQDYQGGVGSIDPGTTPATVTLGAAAGSWSIPPMLAANPDGELVAGEPSQSPDELASYDVSDGTAKVLADQQFIGSAGNMGDLAITPDGTDVVVASGAPYVHQVFKVSDLSPDGQYTTTTYPDSVAIAADGTVLAGVSNWYGDSIYVFAPGNPDPVTSYPLSSDIVPPDGLAPAGLAVTPDGGELFAVTADPYGGSPVLNIFPNPEQTAAGLTLTGPATVHHKSAVDLTGSLTGNPLYTGGRTLHVTRTDPAHPAGLALPDVTTASDGTFTLTDQPGTNGTITYQVSYAGDPHLSPATATATVRVL